ncbi:MAG: ATP-dependent RNA helicase SUPV3L1/SUV3 [Paracoccaceae bacterium]|jgi:ATP-dependent RNA helicase SUPV3L1/SUV3
MTFDDATDSSGANSRGPGARRPGPSQEAAGRAALARAARDAKVVDRGYEGHRRDNTVIAILGPTNTGKTHYAIERMLGHRTGVIGLPLRLLAREVYDKIVLARGPSCVGLITGEEKIAPPRAQYWVCTVEAMPIEQGADFVAVDEIQLCADPDRGHVFTDRLLNARGLHETLFLGSDSMKSRIADLIPKARFERRERFSTLSYVGARKLGRMPARSAIVGFSVDNVYAIAELMRRQKGGAAVVMGALSPRTRNAQVELYQNGDVDHLVATDAIGMGLNLDVRHVAFSALSKFDGRRFRDLMPHELAQIAGRAGRYQADGTFGVTGEAHALDQDVIDAIENHRFAPVAKLAWRNSSLNWATLDNLIASLEAPPDRPGLVRARDADDMLALRRLAEDEQIRAMASGKAELKRLWDVCRIPDFRKTSPNDHVGLLSRIYRFLLSDKACIPSDWMAGQIRRVDRVDGDIDALAKRLAFIRTWTYVATRRDWVEEAPTWREATRDVEDRLSDALHQRLTQRFVDRRTSVLMRRLKQKEALVADVNDAGEVSVEGHLLGRIDGFRFTPDPEAKGDEAKTLRAASTEGLASEFSRRADKLYNAPDAEIDLTEQGGLMWGEHAVGKLVSGADAMRPEVKAFVDEIAGEEVVQRVERRLRHWLTRKVDAQFEPLIKLSTDEALTGLARGLAYRLAETMGIIPRSDIAKEVKELDQEGRAQLRKHGVRFGQHTVFMPALLKPAPTRLRLVLWGLAEGLDDFPGPLQPGIVTSPAIAGMPAGFWPRAGYRLAGVRAIRIDMLERLADLIRNHDGRTGFEASADMLSITGCTLEQFAEMMQGLGWKAEKAERPKVKPAPDKPKAEVEAEEAPVEQPVEAAVGTPDASAEMAEPDADAVAPEPTQVIEPALVIEPAQMIEIEAEAALEAEDVVESAPAADAAPVEMQSFYTFTWAPRPRRDSGGGGNRRRGAGQGGGQGQGQGQSQGGGRGAAPADAQSAAAPADGGAAPAGDAPQRREGGRGPRQGDGPRGPRRDFGKDGFGKDGPGGSGPRGPGKGGPKGKPNREPQGPRTFTARPETTARGVDPDNPFAALMALKDKS